MHQIFKTSINKLKDFSSFNLKSDINNNLYKNKTELALEYNIDNFNNDVLIISIMMILSMI